VTEKAVATARTFGRSNESVKKRAGSKGKGKLGSGVEGMSGGRKNTGDPKNLHNHTQFMGDKKSGQVREHPATFNSKGERANGGDLL